MRLNRRSITRAGVATLLPAVALFSSMTFLPVSAYGDDQAASGDVARDQLAKVIAVLRLQPAAAGQSCLDALHEVHHTEDQVKILQNKATNPDLALSQDVLDTDYENAKEMCGADAGRVCSAPAQVTGMDATCGALRQGSRSR